MRNWYIVFFVIIVFCLLVFPILRENSFLFPCLGNVNGIKITSICNYFSNNFFESVGNTLIGILLAFWFVEGYIRRIIEENRDGKDLLTYIDWVVWAWQGGPDQEFHIDVLNSRLMVIDATNDKLSDETKDKFALLAKKASFILEKKTRRSNPNLNSALRALINLKKDGKIVDTDFVKNNLLTAFKELVILQRLITGSIYEEEVRNEKDSSIESQGKRCRHVPVF